MFIIELSKTNVLLADWWKAAKVFNTKKKENNNYDDDDQSFSFQLKLVDQIFLFKADLIDSFQSDRL